MLRGDNYLIFVLNDVVLNAGLNLKNQILESERAQGPFRLYSEIYFCCNSKTDEQL